MNVNVTYEAHFIGTRIYTNGEVSMGWSVFQNSASKKFMVMQFDLLQGLDELYETEEAAWQAAKDYSEGLLVDLSGTRGEA